MLFLSLIIKLSAFKKFKIKEEILVSASPLQSATGSQAGAGSEVESQSLRQLASNLLAAKYASSKTKNFAQMVQSLDKQFGSGWDKWLTPDRKTKFSLLKCSVAGSNKDAPIDAQTEEEFRANVLANKPKERSCCLFVTSFLVSFAVCMVAYSMESQKV